MVSQAAPEKPGWSARWLQCPAHGKGAAAIDEPDQGPPNRFERRKLQTRAALIRAAQSFIAAGEVGIPILEITRAADVGMARSTTTSPPRGELFAAAVAEVLDRYGALLDELTDAIDDPAEAFAVRYRHTTASSFRWRA
jgi:hypothetical protein